MTQAAKCVALFLACVFGAFFLGNAWDNNASVNLLETPTNAADVALGQAVEQLEWKSLPCGGSFVGEVLRGKVPGGWLILVNNGSANSHRFGTGLTFVPDPEHAWQ